jgi:hypothetical protein
MTVYNLTGIVARRTGDVCLIMEPIRVWLIIVPLLLLPFLKCLSELRGETKCGL